MSQGTTKGRSAKRTPPLSTYDRLKARYKDTILLMKVGDTFECYGDDAYILNLVTGLVFRPLGLFEEGTLFAEREACGFPATQLDTYLPKLIRAGYKVAVCEPLDKAPKGATIENV